MKAILKPTINTTMKLTIESVVKATTKVRIKLSLFAVHNKDYN